MDRERDPEVSHHSLEEQIGRISFDDCSAGATVTPVASCPAEPNAVPENNMPTATQAVSQQKPTPKCAPSYSSYSAASLLTLFSTRFSPRTAGTPQKIYHTDAIYNYHYNLGVVVHPVRVVLSSPSFRLRVLILHHH